MKLDIEYIYYHDPDDEDCDCDYMDAALSVNGQIVAHYGDHYHDKGEDKIEGFVDALRSLGYELNESTHMYVADDYSGPVLDVVPLTEVLPK